MNAKRGQVTIDVGGETYTIRLGTNAMARYQTAAGETVTQAFAKIETGAEHDEFDALRVRRLFWAALEGEYTEEFAGDLMDEYGIGETIAKIGESAALAFPSAGKTDKGNSKSRQPKSATR